MATGIWDWLANYESIELTRADYQRRHGRTPSTSHAREITAPFSHARSYFRSARGADATVKPLLLYYGVISLSRGLTLLLMRGRREATLAPAHGLSTKDWGATLSGESPDFSSLKVSMNSAGSYQELAEATNYTTLLEFPGLYKNISSAKFHALDAGFEVSISDIVSRIPELSDHYKHWREDVRCAECSIQSASGLADSKEDDRHKNHIVFHKSGPRAIPKTLADLILSESSFRYDRESVSLLFYKGPATYDSLPGIRDFEGNVWVTSCYAGGARLSWICTLFILSYSLGMLVRYHPTQWTSLIRSQVNDAALPTLSAAVELIEREYPATVLRFLRRI